LKFFFRIQQVKRDRKLKESHKKPKITESRKHLANLRVVQRNIVFVNGLPSRLADTELLRRNDHFGKYGKIVKLVTSPAHNGQLNSICVYITYSRSEEALRAIQALCNYHVDGRTLKATLGTTKYCSRYLKGALCQKTDCLYLHEPGDPLASFTKEQMQQG
jgi:CCR4-NOT transcription complex subunit 4